MRFVRAAAVAAALSGLTLLAACGGGGGGNTTPPVVPPGGPPPATASPTANPSGSPSVSPSSSPSANPSSSPSAKPSSSPSPMPSQTPTAPPPTPVPPTPTPGSTPTPPPSQVTIQVGNGIINGADDKILSSAPNTHNNGGEGDLEPGDPGALPQGGGQGPDVDNIPTATSMSDNYHVHAYLGLIVNGQQIAIPDGVGMVNPFGDFPASDPCTGNTPNFECYADSFYEMHTHDASGAIHMEAPSPVCGPASNYTQPCNMSIFTLGNFLDIWGISSSANNFGPFNGPVTVYTSPLNVANPCPASGGPSCYTASNTYSQYNGDLRSIALYSHTVVWVVVGTTPAKPADLPNIEWALAR